MQRLLFTLILAAAFALPAWAARIFPPNIDTGELQENKYPNIQISGKTYRLPPGGKIYDRQNRIIFASAVPPEKANVVFQLDLNGELSKMWLMTPEEEANPPKKPRQ